VAAVTVTTTAFYRPAKFNLMALIAVFVGVLLVVGGIVAAGYYGLRRMAGTEIHFVAGDYILQPQGSCYTLHTAAEEKVSVFHGCLDKDAVMQLDEVSRTGHLSVMVGKVSKQVATLRYFGQNYRPYHGYVIIPLGSPGIPFVVEALDRQGTVIQMMPMNP
jgi:hypothetical protein